MPPRLRPPSRRRTGFTLTEILVILGIILLVMTFVVPSFVAIGSGQTKEVGRNIIAASLARARGEAIRRGVPCGVYFFVDYETGRTALALVAMDSLGDPDPYDEYKAFAPGYEYQGATPDPLGDSVAGEPPMTFDRVRGFGTDSNPVIYTGDYASYVGRPVALTWSKASTAASVSNPGSNADLSAALRDGRTNVANDFSDGEWLLSGDDATLSPTPLPGTDIELLPQSVGVQLITGAQLNDSEGSPSSAAGYTGSGGGLIERYERTGVIGFDAQGTLLVDRNYAVEVGGGLGQILRLPDIQAAAGVTLGDGYAGGVTRIGVVVYDNEAFAEAQSDGTALEWKGDYVQSIVDSDVMPAFVTSVGDANRAYPDLTPGTFTPPPQGEDPPSPFDEFAEERWLDANTVPLIVNRYTGTLVEAANE